MSDGELKKRILGGFLPSQYIARDNISLILEEAKKDMEKTSVRKGFSPLKQIPPMIYICVEHTKWKKWFGESK